MPKLIAPLAAAVAAVLATVTVTTMTSRAAEKGYAEDRAAIEDLQARYLFAMDFHDPDRYVQLFSKRRIYNENRNEWAYKGGGNPAW